MIINKENYTLMVPDWDVCFIHDAKFKDTIESFSSGKEREIIDKFISENSTGIMVDIGSNMGYWSIYMSQFYDVYSYEPDFENYKCLEYNVENNKGNFPININNFAISDSEKNISTFRHTTGLNCGMISVKQDDNSSIKAVTLDSLSLKNIKILKIDTEGHGYFVLCGATKTLMNESPMIVIETNNLENIIYNLPEDIVENKLNEMGYRKIFDPSDDPGKTSNSIFIK
jgi:FkbM family methyltransferase